VEELQNGGGPRATDGPEAMGGGGATRGAQVEARGSMASTWRQGPNSCQGQEDSHCTWYYLLEVLEVAVLLLQWYESLVERSCI